MSFMGDLREQDAGADVESWIPENAGDQIAGFVRRLTTGSSDYGDFNIVVVDVMDANDQPTGVERSVAFLGAVMSNWFAERKDELKPGAMLGVRFDGTRESKTPGHNPYKLFTMMLKPAPSFSEQVASEGGQDGLPF